MQLKLNFSFRKDISVTTYSIQVGVGGRRIKGEEERIVKGYSPVFD